MSRLRDNSECQQRRVLKDRTENMHMGQVGMGRRFMHPCFDGSDPCMQLRSCHVAAIHRHKQDQNSELISYTLACELISQTYILFSWVHQLANRFALEITLVSVQLHIVSSVSGSSGMANTFKISRVSERQICPLSIQVKSTRPPC